MRDPAGPGDAAGVVLTQAPSSTNLFPRACITRTLKLNDLNQDYRGAVWFVSGRCLARACYGRSAGRRSQVGHRTSRAHPPQLVSPPPIPALRDLTTTGALARKRLEKIPQMPGIMLTSMASALLTKSQADDPGGALRSCRESRVATSVL